MLLTKKTIHDFMIPRDPEGHKGTFGKVFLVCGSVGFTGAPAFAADAAVRCGSGLVYLAVPWGIWQVEAVKCSSAMVLPMPGVRHLWRCAERAIREKASKCDVLLMGCGMGASSATEKLVSRLADTELPLVLDADALTAAAAHPEFLRARRGKVTILTPHEGEFLRLGGTLGEGREQAAKTFAEIHQVYLILKGHRTVIAAPDGRLAVNPTGNHGMAKGGSGDVLAGMTASLLGQGMAPFEACCAAVWCHGTAGDLAAEKKGFRGMTPDDLLCEIGPALRCAEDD